MIIISDIRRFVYRLQLKRYKKGILRTVRSCGNGLRVNHPCSLNDNTYLGDNVNLNGLRTGGHGKIVIGNNFHSGTECLIVTNVHNYDHGEAIPYGSHDIEKDVIIEDNCWIGDRVIILGGAHLHEGSIIQAGSVVIGDIPYCAIAGGHPARVFKMRDIEHYEKLKAEGKFK